MNLQLPLTAGLSFKPEYFEAAHGCDAAGMWYEIHPENYMIAGGPRLAMLDAICERHPVSVHGVGLSLASFEKPDAAHLQRLAAVVRRTQAVLVSEHLAWSVTTGSYLPDLLPFPRTQEALLCIARNIDITQNVLQRRILIENPSLYVRLEHEYSEAEFLAELVRRTGCGLLLDVNNAYISAHNLGTDVRQYLHGLPVQAIGEIHLAGHAADENTAGQLLIDTHAAPISAAVWSLYETLIARIGPRPTLIERDDNLPEFAELLAERQSAAGILDAAILNTAGKELRHVRVA
ncbi:MAG: DUF692 domain-containing protein [Steroidobacteraceae bacterium]